MPVDAWGSGAGWPLCSNLVAPGRGVLRIGPLGVWVVDPFAVVEVALAPAAAAEAVVVPRPAWAPPGTPAAAALEAAGSELIGHSGRAGPVVRHGDEVAGVAPVVPGAPPGRLHWPTTFRTGEPMALRFAGLHLGADGVVLWLDTRGSVHDATSLESAVAVAAAVGLSILDQRRRLQLIAGSTPVTLWPGPWAAARFLEQLAVVDLEPPMGVEEHALQVHGGALAPPVELVGSTRRDVEVDLVERASVAGGLELGQRRSTLVGPEPWSTTSPPTSRRSRGGPSGSARAWPGSAPGSAPWGSGPAPSVVVTTRAGASGLAGVGPQTTVLIVDGAGGVGEAGGAPLYVGGRTDGHGAVPASTGPTSAPGRWS